MIGATILVIAISWPIVNALYNIFLHPLSRFPGPKIWACSRLPYLYQLLTGNLVKRTRQIHEQYGDIVRLAPDELSFATEQAWTDIYTYRQGHKRAPRDKMWYIAPEHQADNIITTANEKFHARVRGVLSASFTEDALRKQFVLIENHMNKVMAQLYRRTAISGSGCTALNMTDWFNFFTMDVIGDLAFGESFGCLEKGEYHEWVATLFSYLKGMIIAAACRFYPVTEKLMSLLIPQSVLEGQKKHAKYANDRINHRLDSSSTRPDFITAFMKSNADYSKMSRDEIISTFNFVIVGGSETTATTLTGIFNHLTRPNNEKIYNRLKFEIRSRFSKEEDITLDKIVQTMPYLEATIQEGLRLCNPVPGGLFRTVPTGGGIYCGEQIPESTHISIRTFAVLRSRKYFHNPDSFVPERFLELKDRPAEYQSDRLSASKPFSVGFHSCLGRPLALLELRLVLTRIIWGFDMTQDPERVVDFDNFKVMIITQKEPMFLYIKPREGVQWRAETLQS